jgi:ADP-ribose pyrophosphatase YjhB (NUDIX family)
MAKIAGVSMSGKQLFITTSSPKLRQFATSAVAVQAILVNKANEILLLHSPSRNHGWQLVSGALEAGETLLGGTQRELFEELGMAVKARPLGVVHAQTFHFDESVSYMIGIYYLFAYEGGEIRPGDDMAGSEYRWWSLADLEAWSTPFHATVMPWMLKRAVELHDLWLSQTEMPLQPAI